MKFRYEAMNATGEEVSDILEATSRDEAHEIIRRMGFFITRIEEDRPDRKPVTISWFRRIREKLPNITIVEVLVAIAIIGVLIALILPAIQVVMATRKEPISAISNTPTGPSFTTRDGSVRWIGKTVVFDGTEYVVFENDNDRNIEIVKKESR